MDIDEIREFCLSLPAATEDVKWGADLCFCVGAKMFCVVGLEAPATMTFKVRDEEFDTLCETEDFVPAPYVARYKWVAFTDEDSRRAFPADRLKQYIEQSYNLVREKLPKKTLKMIGIT
jgi:predicted DNA-binding protein (MmcQ/YjbR family)